MNTNLKGLGKNLDKQVLKKIMGGTPEGSSTESLGLLCAIPEGIADCKICHAHSTDGSNIDRSFAGTNFALVDSWVTFWAHAGYRVECTIARVS